LIILTKSREQGHHYDSSPPLPAKPTWQVPLGEEIRAGAPVGFENPWPERQVPKRYRNRFWLLQAPRARLWPVMQGQLPMARMAAMTSCAGIGPAGGRGLDQGCTRSIPRLIRLIRTRRGAHDNAA
jgi:hypothetical protein